MTHHTPRKAVTTVPYAIPAVLAALLGGACWRLTVLRRALIRERVVARLDQAAAHRELDGLHRAAAAECERASREQGVLTAAAAVIDAALAAAGTPTNDHQQKGGTDA